MPSDFEKVADSVKEMAFSSPFLKVATTLGDLGGRLSDTISDWHSRLSPTKRASSRDVQLKSRTPAKSRSMRGGKR